VKVGTRLFLSGVVLPSAGTLLMLLLAGQVFEGVLLRDLDRRLLAQAAVESVSLFDGPLGGPHLHVEESKLPPEVRAAAATAAVYTGDGEKVLHSPEEADVPARLSEPGPEGRPALRTVEDAQDRRRELVLGVRAPDRRFYTLWLGASLTPVAFTLRAYHRVAFLAWAGFVLALAIVQTAIARRITGRVRAMVRYLPRLQSGQFEPLPPADPVRDELGELRAALREAAHQLQQAEELKSRFVANAAHELRTPLGLIRTEIDLALRRPRDEAELRAALEEVRREVDRLARLAGRLLELESLPRRAPGDEPVDLVDLARAAAAGWEASAAEREVRLTVRGPDAAVTRGDATALRQALDNLLSNALRHAPARTSVLVEVAPAGADWQVAVEDAGPGIPPAERERVFEPFQRAPGAGKGAGLGLAIVQEIAAQHGGRARAEDPTAGPSGARVILELPGVSAGEKNPRAGA
jgi:signal transduction histidine kinase